MKIALLGEFPSEPVTNFSDSIMRHCKYEMERYHRFANLSQIDADVIYYMNILDLLLHEEAYGQIENKSKKYKICTSALSYRILEDEKIHNKLRSLENYIEAVGGCNEEIINGIDFSGAKYTTRIAPNEVMFKQVTSIEPKEKIVLGYVGTQRKCKRYHSVIEPLIKKYEQITEFIIVGKAGYIVAYPSMNAIYNSIDVLLMSAITEGAPVPPLEAGLCGRMSIVTACPIMKEVFDDRSAIMIGVSDNIPSTIAAFEDAILDLYEHKGDIIEKGQKAKEAVKEKANWKNIIKNYETMFEECAK